MAFDKNTPMGKPKAVAMQDEDLDSDANDQASIPDAASENADNQEPESDTKEE